MLRRRVFVVDQILGSSKPVIEHVLLLFEHALFVPVFTVLAAAAQIGDGKPSALLKPPSVSWTPGRREADVEAAVTGHKKALRTILLEILFARDEHRDLRAVFGFVKDLLEIELTGVEGDLRLGENVAPAGER